MKKAVQTFLARVFRKKKGVSRNGRAEKYAGSAETTQSSLLSRRFLGRFAFLVVFVTAGVALFPPSHRTREVMFKAGEIADREVIAPFDFQVPLSAEELDLAKARASVSVPPVYVRDRKVEKELTAEFKAVLDSLGKVLAVDTLSRQQMLNLAGKLLPYLSENSLKVMLLPKNYRELSKAALSFQAKIFSRGLLDNSGPLRRSDYTEIAVVDGQKELRMKVKNVIDQGGVDRVIREQAVKLFGKGRDKARAFGELVRSYLLPNLLLDVKETQNRRSLAMESVAKFFQVSKNQRIIGKHDKVTREQENILKALEKTRADRRAARSPLVLGGLYLGEILRLFLFGLLFGGYLLGYHRGIYDDLLKLGALFAVTLIFLVFAAVVTKFGLNMFLIPVAFVSLMLTALFNFRLGVVGTVLMAILIPLLAGTPVNLSFVVVVGGVVACLALKKLRARTHFYKVFLYLSLAHVVGVLSVELGQEEGFAAIYSHSFWGIMNALFSSASAMFLLPVFESIFNLTTRFTLLELTDLNKPILKRLNMEAPGTYHHSMLLGNLVDSVAQEIGADPLRARVMAYYHDVGKIFKPEYFAENQEGGINKHEKITPQMSSLILVSHVKDGVELAREEKLPDIIIDAIREHHGTTVMAFFYQKALETDSHSSVKKDHFRYPGPRPKSKEAAILMLADTVEAAVRSLKEPTPAHIRNMVEKLVNARAQEGELDNSGLTLNDLARIREKFISILTGMYHRRVAYPGQDSEEKEKGEAIVKPIG